MKACQGWRSKGSWETQKEKTQGRGREGRARREVGAGVSLRHQRFLGQIRKQRLEDERPRKRGGQKGRDPQAADLGGIRKTETVQGQR